MNTKNSKTNEPHKFKLSLSDKISLKNPNKNIALSNLSIYYTWKNIKSAYNNNKFKISAPNWNDTFDLPDGSYSFEDIFFLSGLSFTDTDDTQDSRGREGTSFYSTLLLPPAHKHSDNYLQLCV